MIPLVQRRYLTPPGLEVTMPANITPVIPQDGLGGFHAEFTLITPAKLPDTPFPRQGCKSAPGLSPGKQPGEIKFRPKFKRIRSLCCCI